ncbi:hypothetical protein I9018_13695 [Pseudomonas sp. MPFS]|nr:hypothetical protein [Pseudomonas sp. MPFS]UMZ14677.1 hypothetical protein I9018_13695 [Pseudomonas sp. MPFS]
MKAPLQQQGCEEGQGYYFSKALAVEDFAHLLDNRALPPWMVGHDQ